MLPVVLTSTVGVTQAIQVSYVDPDGGANIKQAEVNITQTTGTTTGFYGKYDKTDGKLWLRHADGSGWAASCLPGQTGVMVNTLVVVNCKNSGVVVAGDVLTVTWSVMPKSGFEGTWSVFIYQQDMQGSGPPWAFVGRWTIDPTTLLQASRSESQDKVSLLSRVGSTGDPEWSVERGTPIRVQALPVVGDVIPSAGGGVWPAVFNTIVTTYSDGDGYGDINDAYLLINASAAIGGGFYGWYDRVNNRFYLGDDSGTIWLGGYAPGTAVYISNSRVTLNVGQSSVSGVGDVLTVTWKVQFKMPMSGQTWNSYLRVVSGDGSAGWTQRGTYKVNHPTTTGGMLPVVLTSTVGVTQAIQVSYVDPDGGANIKQAEVNITQTTGTTTGFYGKYDKTDGKLWLRHADGSGWAASCLPGQTGVMVNTLVVVNCKNSGVVVAGDVLTVTWSVMPKSGFEGTWSVFIYQQDMQGSGPPWAFVGRWTIQRGSTNFCGVISVNTTWNASGSPYLAYNCDITITQGVKLTLDPGAILKILTGTVYNYGTLVGNGTAAEPAVITSWKDDAYGGDSNGDGGATAPAKGDWNTILVTGTGSISLNHTIVQYGGTGVGLISTIGRGGPITVTNSTLAYSKRMGIYARDTSPSIYISNTRFLTTSETGLYVFPYNEPVTGTIINNVFINTATSPTATSHYSQPVMLNLHQPTSGRWEIAGNSGANNRYNGMYVEGYVNGPFVLGSNAITFPYIAGGIHIMPSGAITIAQGNVVKFMFADLTTKTVDLSFMVGGRFVAQGSPAQPVVFTSIFDDSYGGDTNGDGSATTPGSGDWHKIWITQTSGSVNLNNAILRYGGGAKSGSTAPANVVMDTGGGLTVTNSIVAFAAKTGVQAKNGRVFITGTQFLTNGLNGLELQSATTALSAQILTNTFQGNGHAWTTDTQRYAMRAYMGTYGFATGSAILDNSGSGNNRNAIYLDGSRSGTMSLRSGTGLPFWVPGFTIEGKTLTLLPGTIVKFANTSSYIQTISGGVLNVAGQNGKPVVFTSSKDDNYEGDTNGDGSATLPAAGDWQYLLINPGTTATLDYARVQYGGSTTGGAIYNLGTLTVTHSAINDNAYYGIRDTTGNCTVTGNDIADNDFGLTSSVGCGAENNWWGDASGPYDPVGNPGGLGDQVSANVDYNPWVTTPYGW